MAYLHLAGACKTLNKDRIFYLAAFTGVDAIVEPGRFIATYSAQNLVVPIEFCNKQGKRQNKRYV